MAMTRDDAEVLLDQALELGGELDGPGYAFTGYDAHGHLVFEGALPEVVLKVAADRGVPLSADGVLRQTVLKHPTLGWKFDGFGSPGFELPGFDPHHRSYLLFTGEIPAPFMHALMVRRIPLTAADGAVEHRIHDLWITIDNDGDLYRQARAPLEDELRRRFAEGSYDHREALEAWKKFVNLGARQYTHGDSERTMADFPKFIRDVVAHNYAILFEEQAKIEAEDATELNGEQLKRSLMR